MKKAKKPAIRLRCWKVIRNNSCIYWLQIRKYFKHVCRLRENYNIWSHLYSPHLPHFFFNVTLRSATDKSHVRHMASSWNLLLFCFIQNIEPNPFPSFIGNCTNTCFVIFLISGTIAFREKAYILISYAWWGELKFRNKELGKQNVLTSHIVTNNGWSWDHNRFCQ